MTHQKAWLVIFQLHNLISILSISYCKWSIHKRCSYIFVCSSMHLVSWHEGLPALFERWICYFWYYRIRTFYEDTNPLMFTSIENMFVCWINDTYVLCWQNSYWTIYQIAIWFSISMKQHIKCCDESNILMFYPRKLTRAVYDWCSD